MKNFVEKEKLRLSNELIKLDEIKKRHNAHRTFSTYKQLDSQKKKVKSIIFRLKNASRILSLVEQAKRELLGETFNILRVEEQIKDIFKTEDSLLTNPMQCEIKYSDDLHITYPYTALNEYIVCITFLIKKFRRIRKFEHISATVTKIRLTDQRNVSKLK